MPAEQVDHGIVIGVARGATLRRFVGVSAAALALAGIVVGVSGGGPGPSREGTNSREYATAVERISPGSLAGAPAAQSPEEQARLERGLVDLRADLARGATGAASTSADETSSDAPATTAVQAPEFHGAPNGFLTVSRENTLADDAGRANQVSSPVAVTQASQVFMAGRAYASFSTDNGTTWSAPLKLNTDFAYEFAEPIFRLGNDYSKGIILSTGYVGQRTGNGLVTCLTDGHPGVSGGGVLNRDGDLVGIPIGRMQGDYRFSFILPLRREMFRKIPTLLAAAGDPAT